jgi:hypothetical protein
MASAGWQTATPSANLADPAVRSGCRAGFPRPPVLHRLTGSEAQEIAECFISARTKADSLVAVAYRITVAGTGQATPYRDADELIASVSATRTLEVTTSPADRAHPLLSGEAGGAYYRFRAVHDRIGHVATGYGFDRDGEYSAWLVQRTLYTGLARWAAATELHGEISALWATGQVAEHKAVLLDRDLLKRHSGIREKPGTMPRLPQQ